MDRELGGDTGKGFLFSRLTLWIVLATILTLIVLQYSFRTGRLTDWPTFDDVGYMADAASRINALWVSGPGILRLNYVKNPPHSPFETALAMTAFLIFGIRDWAPYAMNGLLIVGYLAFADYLLRGLHTWQKLFCLVFLLSQRLLIYAVNEFRPDHACGLFTAAGCILILERRLLGAGVKRLLSIGVLFGLALITKPSTFIATLMLMGACLTLGTVADWVGERQRLTFAGIVRSWGTICVTTALVAFPHFYLAWREITSYIYDNVFGKYKEIWRFKATLPDHLLYYLRGPIYPGSDDFTAMLGKQIVLLGIIVVLSWAVVLMRWQRREITRMIVMALLLLGTYVMAAMNPVKSLFFGLPFQTCLVLLAVQALGYLIANIRLPVLATAFSFCAAVVAMYLMQWPVRNGDYNSPQQTSLRQIPSGVFDTVTQRQGARPARVLIMGVGAVNPAVMTYRAIQQQRDVSYYGIDDASTIPQYVAEWDNCDFIVASQSDTKVTAGFLLSYRLLDELLGRLRERKDFKAIGFFPFVYSGRGYYVFEKVRPPAPEQPK
jgi:hypothetical protein